MATLKKNDSALRIGSRVFHPSHGVVSVLGVERRELGSSVQDFYVLGLARGGRLLLPVSNLAQAGVRQLVSPTKARQLMEKVRTSPESRTPGTTKASWRERAATYKDGLRSGSPDRYTEILSELLFRSRSAKLSVGDQQVLDVAHDLFVGEMGAVLGCSPHEIEAGLSER